MGMSSVLQLFYHKVLDTLKLWPDDGTKWKNKLDKRSYYSLSPGKCLNQISTNPSNCCRDISLHNQKCQPHGGTREVRGSSKSLGFILWGPWISVPNLMAIHPTIVKTFQSGPKWWTGQPTSIALHRTTLWLVPFFPRPSDKRFNSVSCFLVPRLHHWHKAYR